MEKNTYSNSLQKLIFLLADVFYLYTSLKLAVLLSIVPPLPESSFPLTFLLFALLWILVEQWFGNKNNSIEWGIYFKSSITNLFYIFLCHALLFFSCLV